VSYLFDQFCEEDEGIPIIENKVLLMGLQEAGKTAIKDVVFFQKNPDLIHDYMATVHYQRDYIDNEKKTIVIDSGGQESYWNEAVTQFRHLVFSNVKLLIWIIDVTRPDLFEESERRFSFTVRQYKKDNPEGLIYVFCHKVDLLQPEQMIIVYNHIIEMFKDPRFEIRYENTSIYFPDSLRELVFTLMTDAGINAGCYELISNVGTKIEQSEEFQSFICKKEDDKEIQKIMELFKPEPEQELPTLSRQEVLFDFTEHDFIELILFDKNSFSPLTGVNFLSTVSIEKSMNYILALHEFKSILEERRDQLLPKGSILISADVSAHGLLFPLKDFYLLITSFSEFSEQKRTAIYDMLFDFTESKEEIIEISDEKIVDFANYLIKNRGKISLY
jgi:signal recognition particle receptor subunit beta